MASFKKFNLPFGNTNYPSSGEVTIYTQTAAQSSVVVGLSVSNKTEFDLPCDVWILKGGGSTKHYLAKSRRVPAGETVQLIDSGQKLVLSCRKTHFRGKFWIFYCVFYHVYARPTQKNNFHMVFPVYFDGKTTKSTKKIF